MDHTPDREMAARVRRLRQALGLTQIELGHRLGVSNVTVNRWERGRSIPGPAARTLLNQLEATVADVSISPPSADIVPIALPQPATGFVGRRDQVAAVSAALSSARLVTLIGPGGVGKTRLAIEVARTIDPLLLDGVRWISLAALTDVRLVPEMVVNSLGLTAAADTPLIDLILAWGKSRRVLLVIDNCEHLISACAEVISAVLLGCPGVRLLATSRAPLDVPGEQVWPVPPLGLPDLAISSEPAAVMSSEAGRLFLERARARHPAFAVTSGNALAIAELCRRLDGLPLALELAVTRIPLLTPAEIVARLDDRFLLLRTMATVVAPRHRALEATLDWSYHLLTPSDRVVFVRLAVFVNGFDLPAIEAIAADTIAGDVLGSLGRLVAQSLVEVATSPEGGPTRYRMLETVQAYVQELLSAGGESNSVRRRHAEYFVSVAEVGAPALDGTEQVSWLARLDAERDNLRAALRWFDSQQEHEKYLTLASALWRYWWVRGSLEEGRRWLTAGLVAADTVAPVVRARALTAAGILAREQADFAAARVLLAAGLAGWREADDPVGLAFGLTSMALASLDAGDYEAAALGYSKALAIGRSRGDQQQIALRTFNLAVVALARQDLDDARSLLAESLPVLRALDHRFGLAIATFASGAVEAKSGKLLLAEPSFSDALGRFRELGYPDGIALALDGLGHCHRGRGEITLAESCFTQALQIWRSRGVNHRVAHGLQSATMLFADRGEWRRSAQLAGAVATVAAGSHAYFLPVPPGAYEAALDLTRAHLGEESYRQAWIAGAAHSIDEAISSIRPSTTIASAGNQMSGRLTARNVEVIRFAASGRTNDEIAVAMGIGVRTVERHLSVIYAVLGARGRTDAVSRAIAAGLITNDSSRFPIAHS